MKKCLIILLLVPSLAMAQYWGERVTERSFEQSSLYFNSYFLNPYGVDKFGDVAVGMIDDPFLNLHLNPSNIPSLSGKSVQFYLDFRGDRTEEQIITAYYGRTMDYGVDAYYYRPDPRWYSVTRSEPEPVFSVGMLAYPLGENSKQLLVGGTYQLIYKQEKYYRVPSWIYYPAVGYDAFGERADDAQNIPIQDRYYGKDELLTEGHLLTGYVGYTLAPRSTAGIAINTVSHSRDGGYINSNSDEYGNTNQREYISYSERMKDHEYSHFDISGGLSHEFYPDFRAGVKVGYLSGDADQDFMSVDSSHSQYREPNVTNTWSYYTYRSTTTQSWKQDGNTFYVGFNFEKEIDEQKTLAGYYKFSSTDIDMQNASAIKDTSYNTYRWEYTDGYYESESVSSTSDQRTATGNRERKRHQIMLNLDWTLTEKSRVVAGLFYQREQTDVNSSEPVIADRWSDYWRDREGDIYTRFRRLFEDKQLEWSYSSREWTIKVPIILILQIDPHFSMMVGANRVLKSWKIEDETIAFFDRRERTENGETNVEENFGERYHQADQKFTEDYTDLILSCEVIPKDEFRIRLILDPEFDNNLRIAQWWLSFHFML